MLILLKAYLRKVYLPAYTMNFSLDRPFQSVRRFSLQENFWNSEPIFYVRHIYENYKQ